MTFRSFSWPATLLPLALVASPRLGLRELNINIDNEMRVHYCLLPFSLVVENNNKPMALCCIFVFFPLVVDDNDKPKACHH